MKLGEYRKQGKLLASLYLRANEELALKSVGTGTFRLAFTLGTDWDQGARRFNQASFYKTFDESIQFTETKDVREVETESGIEIQTKIGAAEWTFTLHAVPSGNAKATSIDEGTFDHLFVDDD